ncbi:uncharacterized membrane protein (DUF485 family) [Streptomyces sp. SAI-170]|uniref:DUF485 domain-containing protein n=1 Tax=Streptomyces sp. SAI-170 TaxID=3377729 RepID=UPI003C7BD693
MTYPDDKRYPPPTPPQWPQSRTEPYSRTPRHPSYGQEPGQQPQPSGYGGFPGYDPFGQTPRPQPHTHEAHAGSDLAALRSAYRVLRRVSTLTALGSFVVYVLLSCYAPDLMGSKIIGELSLGMSLGVLQLVVTFGAVSWYGRSAHRSVDPLAHAVRERAAARHAGVAR